MVNDENDKWADDGELPISISYDSKNLNNQLKRKTMNNRNDGLKDISTIEKTENSKSKDLVNIVDLTKREKFISEKTNTDDTFKELSKDNQERLVKENQEILVKENQERLVKENQELNNKLSKLKEESRETKYLKDFGMYLKNLDSAIGQLTKELKTFTDAKSWEAISRGNLDVRRYANYYDVHSTITTAGTSDPNDFDSPVYNVERVFEYLERYSEIIYVTNDGTDLLHVIVSHGGRTRFSTEATIYPNEVKCYFNVYEIRLRSPTAGLPYRVTEYCLHNLSDLGTTPIEKANLHNQALPAIGANWLATNITPTNTPTTFRTEVAVSIAGNFSAIITKGGNAQTVIFNVIPGPALIAGGLYIFNLLVHSGDTVNFIYSATGGTIQILRVQEVDSAMA